MNQRTLSPAHTGSLSDLFVPQVDLARIERQCVLVSIPEDLETEAIGLCARRALMPDTLFAAAWLLVRSRWLGGDAAQLTECAGAPAGGLGRGRAD